MIYQPGRRALGACLSGMVVVLAACSDPAPTEPGTRVESQTAVLQYTCSADVRSQTVKCGNPSTPQGVQPVIIGNQNVDVKLTSSNVSYNSVTEIFQFDVTVQNLMNEAIGTPDGTLPDPEGIQVFFHSGPTATVGSGTITVANADGTGNFTSTNQPYFAYNEILPRDSVSSVKTWQLNVPNTVTNFQFTVLLETDVQYLLVINEVLANPVGPVTGETPSEWFEIYNAGSRSVDLQGLVIADSAASGRRPYHLISSSLVVAPGGYVVLGGSTDTTVNSGAPVDYAYGSALSLANSLDAVKIARVFGMDTLTIDRIQYSNSSTSAKEGISRELTNPALDNSNMDGSNWADAMVTSAYSGTYSGGPATNRGTPKAQNSTFTL